MRKYLILLVIAIFVIPYCGKIPLVAGPAVWFPQYLAFLFFLGLFGSLKIWEFNKYASVFTVICLLSMAFMTLFHPKSFMMLISLYVGCLVSFGISRFNERQRYWLGLAITSFIVFQIGFCVVQYFGLERYFISNYYSAGKSDKINEVVGFVASGNQIGAILGISFCLFFKYFKIKKVSPFIFLALAILLYKKSFFGILALTAGVATYSILVFKKKGIICILLLVLGLGFYLWKIESRVQIKDLTRLRVWKYAISSTVKGEIHLGTRKNPQVFEAKNFIFKFRKKEIKIPRRIFGFGFGSWKRIFPRVPQGYRHTGERVFNYSDEKWARAHSVYVELFFELRYFSIIIFLFLADLFRRIWKQRHNKELALYTSCFVAYGFNEIGNFSSYLAVNSLLFIIFWGLVEGCLRERQKR